MTHRIDARGLRCPWPAIRLSRALRDGHAVIEIIADDPAAPAELAGAAAAWNADIAPVGPPEGRHFRILAVTAVNGSFTRES